VLQNEGSINYEQPDIEINREPLNQSRDKLDHSSGYIGYNQVVNPNNDHDKTDKTDTTGYLDYTSNEIENSNEKISKSKDKLEHSSGYIGYNSES